MAWIPPWTRDDDKRFELALVIFPEGSASFLENIAQLLQKPLGLVKYHYDALVYDVALVESGKYALPKYPDDDNVSLTEATQSKHGIPWTEEEHRLFLDGLNKYGKGAWSMISREFVKTRTKIQVASHAQKYDKRQKLDINKRKRRSIHDITSESTMGKPDNFGV
ncbi:Myb domain plants protein [Arabidopsis suecica]|uniref:Myb domain plants protein n=1 Tax=Arabidopsis suecica TaxID=45249 RepID=A0A8T2BCK7_ARASU|nr:Myb domain plants protein [Arabidopsis suecica]